MTENERIAHEQMHEELIDMVTENEEIADFLKILVRDMCLFGKAKLAEGWEGEIVDGAVIGLVFDVHEKITW